MTHDFTYQLLQWFQRNKRSLPWRGINDPYAIWLSEIILQQTRIQQGTAYWEKFMKRWPNVQELANATEDEILREWQGLGYYSRARNLHVAAKQILQLGYFPNSFHELKKLKGVGDYTAAAIASFAFNIPVAAVDGNVFRVLARYFGIDVPIDTTAGKKLFLELAQQLIPSKQSADFNQAMMDFGSLQCTPLSPNCQNCLFFDSCVAVRQGRVAFLPVKLGKIKIRERKFSYFYIRIKQNGVCYIALRKRQAGDIWQGLWEPLMIEDIKELPHFDADLILLRQNVKHVLTHQVIYADFYLVESDRKPCLPDEFIWIPENMIIHYALPRLVEILLNALPK